MRAVPGPVLRRAERLPHRDLHGVELVVAGHLLRDPAVVVLEDDEVPDEVQEAAVLEHTLDEDPELRLGLPGQFRPIDRAPRLEPLAPGPEDADAGLHAVRHDERRVRREERRDLRPVRLEPLAWSDRRVLVRCVLELEDGERSPFTEDDVGASRAGSRPRRTGSREPVVRRRVVEVDDPGLCATDRAVRGAILHGHAVHQHPVHRAVALHQVRALRAGHLAEGVVQRFLWEAGVQAGERRAESLFEDDVAEVPPLGSRRPGR